MQPKVFVSYSHKDASHQERLDVHLAPLVRDGLRVFYDGCITPGANLDAAIRRELREASIFVALASPDYLKPDYCLVKEYGYARRRASRGTMFVVAVILRPCGWKTTRMARYKSLPRDGREITSWANRDAAYEDVVAGLRRVIAEAMDAKGNTPGRISTPKRANFHRARITERAAEVRTAIPTRRPKATAKKAKPSPKRVPKPAEKASRPRMRRSTKPAPRARPTAG